MEKEKPLGIFGDNLKCLSALKKINSLLPMENKIYIGESEKNRITSEPEFNKYLAGCNLLAKKNCKVIALASDAVTSDLIINLRKEINIPLIDLLSSILNYTEANSQRRNVTIMTKVNEEIKNYYIDTAGKKTTKVHFISDELTNLMSQEYNGGQIKTEFLNKLGQELNKNGSDLFLISDYNLEAVTEQIRNYLDGRALVTNTSELLARAVKTELERTSLFTNSYSVGITDIYLTEVSEEISSDVNLILGKELSQINKIEL